MADLAKIVVNDYGGAPFAAHNMPCAVCLSEPAVLVLNTGQFEPCWGCQANGWRLVSPPRTLRERAARWLLGGRR